MVKQLLLSLLLAASCFGQAFTMSDQPFLAALQGGAPTVQGCGSYTNGLFRYWKMDEGSGTWVKDYVTDNSFAGSLQGSPAWSTDVPAVPIYIRNANSLVFPNYLDYVNCGNSLDYYIITNDYSISAWSLHLTNVTIRNGEVIVEGRKGTLGLGDFHFSLGAGSSNSIPAFAFTDATLNGHYITGKTLASVGQSWTLLTVTRSVSGGVSTWKFYQDGTNTDTYTASGQAYPAEPAWITIGGPRFPDLAQPLNWLGLIADVRIYKNYALSSGEVWCLYHQYYQQP